MISDFTAYLTAYLHHGLPLWKIFFEKLTLDYCFINLFRDVTSADWNGKKRLFHLSKLSSLFLDWKWCNILIHNSWLKMDTTSSTPKPFILNIPFLTHHLLVLFSMADSIITCQNETLVINLFIKTSTGERICCACSLFSFVVSWEEGRSWWKTFQNLVIEPAGENRVAHPSLEEILMFHHLPGLSLGYWDGRRSFLKEKERTQELGFGRVGFGFMLPLNGKNRK